MDWTVWVGPTKRTGVEGHRLENEDRLRKAACKYFTVTNTVTFTTTIKYICKIHIVGKPLCLTEI